MQQYRSVPLFFLKPLLAGVVDFFQDASLFGFAITSGCARRATTPSFGIAKDPVILDKKLVLVVVLVEMIPAGLAIVANVFIVAAHREASEITIRQLRSVLRRIGRVVTAVFVGIKEIKGGLVLEGSMEGRIILWYCYSRRRSGDRSICIGDIDSKESRSW